jgi:hypothetical protein
LSGDADDDGDVIFEIRRVGEIQRVAAIHVPSGIEVVLQAPAKTALADLQALALRKLKRRLSKPPETPPPRRRGKLV